MGDVGQVRPALPVGRLEAGGHLVERVAQEAHAPRAAYRHPDGVVALLDPFGCVDEVVHRRRDRPNPPSDPQDADDGDDEQDDGDDPTELRGPDDPGGGRDGPDTDGPDRGRDEEQQQDEAAELPDEAAARSDGMPVLPPIPMIRPTGALAPLGRWPRFILWPPRWRDARRIPAVAGGHAGSLKR